MKPSNEPPITEEEIRILIDQGTEVGVFGEAEQDMVEGVFRLNERSINAIMTPRTEIAWLDVDDKIDEIIKRYWKVLIHDSPCLAVRWIMYWVF